jgi:hypothetical protein
MACSLQGVLRKQTGERKILMMGGMLEVSKHSSQALMFSSSSSTCDTGGDETVVAPSRGQSAHFEDNNKARVEDLTGRIPLFLRPLLQWHGGLFRDIEEEIWAHRDLVVVGENIWEFAAMKLKVETPMNYEL